MNGKKARRLRQVSDSITRLTPDVEARGMYRYLKRQYRAGNMLDVERAAATSAALRKLGI